MQYLAGSESVAAVTVTVTQAAAIASGMIESDDRDSPGIFQFTGVTVIGWNKSRDEIRLTTHDQRFRTGPGEADIIN